MSRPVMTSTPLAAESGAGPRPRAGSPYWTFYSRVAAAQLSAWLPSRPARVVELRAATSGADDDARASAVARIAAAAGHDVISVLPPGAEVLTDGGAGAPGRHQVRATCDQLTWLA